MVNSVGAPTNLNRPYQRQDPRLFYKVDCLVQLVPPKSYSLELLGAIRFLLAMTGDTLD